ncbi:helix-turn-helix domain-containing protein [Cyclobacterium marinum]|uniref:helix-turn-helix domain-containing protein n=1 Tax=Cyclobacterium marinum TaxID=104 RepID=UPI0009DB2E4B
MANKPISMHRLRQILLCLSRSFSERAISRELSISRITVSRYKSCFLSSGLDYESLLNL